LTPEISARTRSGDPIPAMVLSAELSWMFASDGDRTRWTGFQLGETAVAGFACQGVLCPGYLVAAGLAIIGPSRLYRLATPRQSMQNFRK
jgi:hypothetical protein